MSAEDCFKLASDAGLDAGVRAWGYRTGDYKDKKLRNTCFIYRDGDFTEFKGTNDKTIITGCVGPNMKVANGCLTAEEMAQEIESTSKMQQVLAIAAMAAKMAEQLAKKAATAAINAAKTAARKAKQAAQYAARKAKQAAEAVANAAKRAAQEAARKTVRAARAAANAAKRAAVATANALKNVALKGAKQAVAAAKVAAKAAKQAATAVAKAAEKAAKEAAEAAKKAAKAAAKAAKDAVKAASKAANEAVKATKKAVKAAGKALKSAFGWVCFSPDTPVTLKNGSRVCIKDIKIGDVLVGGTIVDATMQIGNRSKDPYYKIFSKELNDYIYVTGSHYIKHGDKYVKVCDFPDSIRTEEYGKVLSCLVTSTHTIPIGEHTFWDWEDNLVPHTD
jgi:hypothetical protein